MKKYFTITVFSCLFACAISFFLEPNHLAPGGVTGIAILLNALTGIGTGTWVFAINVPVLLLGWWKFGAKFMLSTLYSISVISVVTNLLQGVPALTDDPLGAALAGAFLTALSIGSVMRVGATTGGMDIVVKVMRRKYPHLRTGRLYLIIDSVIVLLAIIIFGNIEAGIYAGITVLVTSYLLDMVLYGNDEAALFYIITKKPVVIANRLMDELMVGVTFIKARGGYRDENKEIILCATRKQQAPKLEEIVRDVDEDAFLIVTRANEIYGMGYKSYENRLL